METSDYNPIEWQCPTCPDTITEAALIAMDQLSLREWKISGMCQRCQDEVFAPCEHECCD